MGEGLREELAIIMILLNEQLRVCGCGMSRNSRRLKVVGVD